MKKIALFLLMLLLTIPAAIRAAMPAPPPPYTITNNESGEGRWTQKITFYTGTNAGVSLYVYNDEIVNGEEFMEGYTAQFEGKDIELQISYTGINITKIGESAFKGCMMNSITIPEGIGSIGVFAFYECNNLTTLNIPESVNYIGTHALSSCHNMESFSGKFVDEDGRSIVTESTASDGETKIYSLISAALKGITKYEIPSNVTHISMVFKDEWDLEEVIIPEGVTTVNNPTDNVIGDLALFTNCGIKTLRVPDSLCPSQYILRNCPNLEKFEGKWASEDGRFLQIPYTEEDYKRYELTDEIYAEIEEMISSGDWTEEEAQEAIDYMNRQLRKYKDKCCLVGFASYGAGETIVIPDNASVLDGTFYCCETIKKVVLPNSVTEIYGAFLGCKNLESVNFPDDLERVSGAFWGCEKLTELVFPAGVEQIGSNTFRGCTALKSVVLPGSSLDTNGNNFINCPNIEYIELGATRPKKISNNSFAPLYNNDNEIYAANTLNNEANFDAKRSDAFLAVPRGLGETYNADFPDWNFMRKENLIEKEMPSNIYVGINSPAENELFAKFVNCAGSYSWDYDADQEILSITPSVSSSEALLTFKSANKKVGATSITLSLSKGSEGVSNSALQFTTKITVVDLITPEPVDLKKGESYILKDYISIDWPDEMPDGVSVKYSLEEQNDVTMTDADSGTVEVENDATEGSSATITVSLVGPDKKTLIARDVTINIVAEEDDPTAIKPVATTDREKCDNAVYYNLNGSKVDSNNLSRGLYLIKGSDGCKKVVVK